MHSHANHPVDPFGRKPVPSVHSTAIASIRYVEEQAILDILFCSGSAYRYFLVPPWVFQAFLAAESKGLFFNRCIKGRFAYARFGAPGYAHV